MTQAENPHHRYVSITNVPTIDYSEKKYSRISSKIESSYSSHEISEQDNEKWDSWRNAYFEHFAFKSTYQFLKKDLMT